MCGRVAQFRSKQSYAESLGWDPSDFLDQPGDRVANWNVPPGSQPWLLHRLGNGQSQIEMVNWGVQSIWAQQNGNALVTSVSLDQATNEPYFKTMFRTSRAIVPVDGWYEWTGSGRLRQPWFIRLKSHEPIFLAAVCSYRSYNVVAEGTGFIVLNASYNGGMIDPLTQRPIVLSAADAVLWIDGLFTAEDAAKLAYTRALPDSGFACFKVGPEVNRVGTNGSHLIAPLSNYMSA